MANTGGYFPENISPPISPIPLNPIENEEILVNNICTNKSDAMALTQKEDSGNIHLLKVTPIFLNDIDPITENNYEMDFCKDLKRKRHDDIDNNSIISNDSFALAPTNSAKKPKLFRTGSISRTLKRSISFVGVRAPLAGKIQLRRNSIDPNSSINSSFDTTINKAVKNTFKSFRNSLTPRRKSPKKGSDLAVYSYFKTPKAPKSKSFSVIKNNLFLASPTIGDGNDYYSDHTVNLNSTPINANVSSNNINIHQHMSSINECDISLSHLNEGNLNTVHFLNSLFLIFIIWKLFLFCSFP